MAVPEFVREGRTVCLLGGMYQALIQQPIDADAWLKRQNHSYSYAASVDLSTATALRLFVTWELSQDYHYHLEGIRAWQSALTTGHEAPHLRFRLYGSDRNRRWCDGERTTYLDVPFNLVTTPALHTQPGRLYMMRVNTTYLAGTLLRLEISGYTVGQPTVPEQLELMTEGIWLKTTPEYRKWLG